MSSWKHWKKIEQWSIKFKIVWPPPCHRSGAAAYSRRLCISVSFSNIICSSFLPLAGGLPATPFFARLFLILVPFRVHFGEVVCGQVLGNPYIAPGTSLWSLSSWCPYPPWHLESYSSSVFQLLFWTEVARAWSQVPHVATVTCPEMVRW